MLDDKERREERRWESLSSGQKLKDWAMRNQYKIILCSRAAGMAIAGGLVWRNRYALLLWSVRFGGS